MSTGFDVVIVNYNVTDHVIACIASLQHHPAISTITVVDNASRDNPVRLLLGAPKARLVRNTENQGFAAACNRGAEFGSAPYIFFVNPDVRIPDDAVDSLVDAFNDPDVGIVGLRLLDEQGRPQPSIYRRPRPAHFFAHAIGWNRLTGVPAPGAYSRARHEKNSRVDVVCGAVMAVRRSVFERLRGFDEQFFMYFEEVDFCLRAADTGTGVQYVAHATAVHTGGAATGSDPAARLFHAQRSRLLFGRKHFSLYSQVLLALTTLIVEPAARVAHSLLTGNWRGVSVVLASLQQLLKWQFANRTRAGEQWAIR